MTDASGAASARVPTTLTSDLAVLPEIAAWWPTLVIRPGVVASARAAAGRIATRLSAYAEVIAETGIPAWWIGCIHELEAAGDFTTHLHNGDPLAHRTTHVPVGRPPLPAMPPFQWTDSAIDALELGGVCGQSDWSIAAGLWRAEKWNGVGYRRMGVVTPYVWAGSTYYVSGKFVRDGIYDPRTVSRQIGFAVLLRALIDLKVITTPATLNKAPQPSFLNPPPLAPADDGPSADTLDDLYNPGA